MRRRTQSMGKLSFDRCYTNVDRPNLNSHWVLMSKDVIPGSVDKSYNEKLSLLKGPSQAPNVIDVVATFCAQFFVSRSESVPGPFHTVDVQTECQEMYDNSFHLKFWIYHSVMTVNSAQHYANFTGILSSIVL
jgi:hypothetical protein